MSFFRVREIWVGLFGITLVVASFSWGLWSGVESFLQDRLFSSAPIDSRIVILAIDNESIQKIGQWPWPREVFARAIRNLSANPPSALGIDVIFAEPSRVGAFDDEALADALREAPFPVVLPAEGVPLIRTKNGYEAGSFLTPLTKLFQASSTKIGHVNLILDPDTVARRFPNNLSLRSDPSRVYSPLSILLAQTADTQAGSPIDTVPRIAYAGQTGSIRRIPFVRLLNEPEIAKSLADSIVLVGATSPDLHDEQITPFSRGVPMPGVEIQAHMVNMSLQGKSLRDASTPFALGILLFFGFLVLACFAYFPQSLKPIAGGFGLGILGLIFAFSSFSSGTVLPLLHIQLAWFLPSLLLVLYRYFGTERERRELKHVFSKYVSADVLNEMLRDPSKIKLGGEEKEATVFFSDVRGFTTMSEKMTPTQLTTFLNKYLTIMTDLILERRGVVDKYIGDAIMAFWGAPLDNPRHHIDALETSLVMTEALAEFNRQNLGTDDPQIDIGIGLNSGRVTAGNMGSEKRFDYTVMGDTVNLASRLEGLTKTYGVHIIISEYTRKLLDDAELESRRILIREVDKVRVKGKKLPVTIFEVVDSDKTEAVRSILDCFNEARTHYYNGEWQTALTEIRRLLAIVPNDGPSKLLHERCIYFSENPPESWEGVYDLKTK